MQKAIVGILLAIAFSIFFITPVRDYLNTLFREDKSSLTEKQIVGMVSGYNPRVQEVQQILKDTGFEPGAIDGLMGAQTRRAIREFQKAKRLKLSGRIDTVTYLALIREKESLTGNNKSKDNNEETALLLQAAGNSAQEEAKGKITGLQDSPAEDLPQDKTKQIQLALKKAGFYKGKIDGKIGPQTRRAIKAFQKANGLKVDGITGKETREKLNKYLP